MPSRLTGIAWLLLVPFLTVRAQEEALLHINGSPVSLNTFLYHYKKQPSEPLSSFLPAFVDYQLQVRYALDNQIDTLPSFRHELAYYTGQLMERCLSANKVSAASGLSVAPVTAVKELSGEELLRNHFSRFSSRSWVKVRHITYPLLQQSSARLCEEARGEMQQLKGRIKGIDALEEVKVLSEREIPAKLIVEDLPWKPLSIFLQEWIAPITRLKVGELSDPFLSPMGVHLVQLVDLSEEMPHLGELSNRFALPSLSYRPYTLQEWSGEVNGGSNPEWQLRMQELKEELLITALHSLLPKELSIPTESQLERFFAENRERYHWELPHYRGVVVHCKDKATYKRWRKLLKKLSPAMRDRALIELTQLKQEPEVSFETGLFQIGQNCYIDKLVFKCGSYELNRAYPYTFVLGERLKRPSSYHDVEKVLLLDYKKATNSLWLEDLRAKYKVELDEEVLKTVNNSASN